MQHPERMLLILDLDETLIHSSEAPLPDRQADFRCGDYYVHKRPYLDSFWEAVGPHFELAVWSSGTDDYAVEISRQIRPPELSFSFVWGRSKCSWRWMEDLGCHEYEKKLARLKRRGYALERMLIVDDTRAKCRSNYGNAIYVHPWHGETDDHELELLSHSLPTLAGLENVRRLEKRDWRRKIQGDAF